MIIAGLSNFKKFSEQPRINGSEVSDLLAGK